MQNAKCGRLGKFRTVIKQVNPHSVSAIRVDRSTFYYSFIRFLITGTPKIIPAPISVKIISGSIYEPLYTRE